MSDPRRALIQQQLSGDFGRTGLPAPVTRDERRIAAKGKRSDYGVQVGGSVHRRVIEEAMRTRVYGVERYAIGVHRMVAIQNRCTDQVRDYAEPFVMNQAIELAHDIQGIASSAVGNMLRIAGQDYTVRPQGFWQRLLGKED